MPFLPPGDLSDSGIKPTSPAAPALAKELFTTEPLGKPLYLYSVRLLPIKCQIKLLTITMSDT